MIHRVDQRRGDKMLQRCCLLLLLLPLAAACLTFVFCVM